VIIEQADKWRPGTERLRAAAAVRAFVQVSIDQVVIHMTTEMFSRITLLVYLLQELKDGN
jgi:hypothetical protein